MNGLTDGRAEDTHAAFMSRSEQRWTAKRPHTKGKYSINYNVIYFTTSLSVCGLD